ncbi:cytochrome c oxidase subunit 3 [Crenobacter caeni]|nr:cytochrome c oxidase subunit 3 [Crenobacter caeni]
MWGLIVAELAVFGLLFFAYAWQRRSHAEAYATAQATLALWPALVGTLGLLTGSFGVALAVHAWSQGWHALARAALYLGIVSGAVFILLKGADLLSLGGRGISLSSGGFWTFYLFLTGFHYLHVLLGWGLLLVVAWRARRGRYDHGDYSGVETVAAYWHMVDLVWVVLFALIYVAR